MRPQSARPWRNLLAEPGPDGHIVQLYQDPEFYGEAISHFAAEGFTRGESIILVATASNWKNISGRLCAKGFDVEALRRQGQLNVLDADQTLPRFLRHDMPDAETFKDIARSTIRKARLDGKYPRVRWWGEMVNVLYVNGNGRGSTRLEELFDEVAHEERVAIFCSFLMDKFDPDIYGGPLGDVCRTHANLIPDDDYARHRDCVDAAIAEVFDKPAFLRVLDGAQDRAGTDMPAAQALLIRLKEAAPDKFRQVVEAARKHEASLRDRS